jgi:hypothetical protein
MNCELNITVYCMFSRVRQAEAAEVREAEVAARTALQAKLDAAEQRVIHLESQVATATAVAAAAAHDGKRLGAEMEAARAQLRDAEAAGVAVAAALRRELKQQTEQLQSQRQEHAAALRAAEASTNEVHEQLRSARASAAQVRGWDFFLPTWLVKHECVLGMNQSLMCTFPVQRIGRLRRRRWRQWRRCGQTTRR